jgi:hypothetical protein
MFPLLIILCALAMLLLGGMHLVSANYIPPKDADLLAWADNFNALVTANYASYGLSAGDAATIDAIVSAFDDAYALCGGTYHAPVNPATKTVVTTQAKNDARTAMLATLRPYAQQIAISPGVSSDDKIALGLNARTNLPTPIPAPTSYPILGIRGMTPLGITLQYQDSAMGTGKAKAPGAIQLELRATVSTTPLTDPDALAPAGMFTKSPLGMSFDSGDGGKTVYVAARWVTRRGLPGPWSAILVTTVPVAG